MNKESCDLAKEAGLFHVKVKKERKNFSYGDAFVLLTARILDVVYMIKN